MPDLMLRLYDGFSHTSPQLRDSVRELQAMLRRHDRAVVVDGQYRLQPGSAVQLLEGTAARADELESSVQRAIP
jgi:hypothetical protein